MTELYHCIGSVEEALELAGDNATFECSVGQAIALSPEVREQFSMGRALALSHDEMSLRSIPFVTFFQAMRFRVYNHRTDLCRHHTLFIDCPLSKAVI
jgi:hypothetical protein